MHHLVAQPSVSRYHLSHKVCAIYMAGIRHCSENWSMELDVEVQGRGKGREGKGRRGKGQGTGKKREGKVKDREGKEREGERT